MTFQNTADLATDEQYRERLSACLYTEALGKPGDPLADRLLGSSPFYGLTLFAPVVASAPGFGDKYATGGQEAVTDPDLLSAVQASWARLSAVHAP
jgi:hypothetical protein